MLKVQEDKKFEEKIKKNKIEDNKKEDVKKEKGENKIKIIMKNLNKIFLCEKILFLFIK